MEINFTPIEVYQEQINKYQEQILQLAKKRRNIAWIRLLVILVTIVLVFCTKDFNVAIPIVLGVIGLAIFGRIVLYDNDLKENAAQQKILLQLNDDEIKILNHDFFDREDGKSLEPQNHDYAQDLDIFGKASLYQFINRCTAEQSKKLLAKRLCEAQPKENILQQQDAAKELQPMLEWRQKLECYGIQNPLTVRGQQRIDIWEKEKNIFTNPYWHWVVAIYPIITIATILLYAYDVIPLGGLYTGIFIFMGISSLISKKIHPVWKMLTEIAPEIATLHMQLQQLELVDFKSDFLKNIQAEICSTKGTASAEILRFKKILDRFDVRLNVFAFFILNTFLLWDLRQLLALNTWKKINQNSIAHWFDAVAKTELVSTVSTLAFNHPQWCWPTILDEHFSFSTTALGHPLIPQNKCVVNNFSVAGLPKIALVTGSNMGGKSTFLRSLGVNTVLAYVGAPVCAESLTLSIFRLMSSMRVADNLAESTSTFYAELKKLETIIKAVNNKEKIWVLLDEILRGTNSLDRHTGSKALVKQFIKQHAAAVLATHDVELANMQTEFTDAINNYHFDVQVANGELYFDYKLKDGICQSLNASILMKKIGIEL